MSLIYYAVYNATLHSIDLYHVEKDAFTLLSEPTTTVSHQVVLQKIEHPRKYGLSVLEHLVNYNLCEFSLAMQ